MTESVSEAMAGLLSCLITSLKDRAFSSPGYRVKLLKPLRLQTRSEEQLLAAKTTLL